jgi:hypothetical protein
MKFDFFPALLMGHLTGDFLLQSKWMALNKSGSSFKCAVHCLIYTLAVSATTYPIIRGWEWSLFIFVSHFPIDRWSLADKWLDLINGRSLPDFIKNGKSSIPKELDFENYHALRAGFTAVVYTVADNTMHLLIMYYGYYLLFAPR